MEGFKNFVKSKRGVAEEFTSLPALMIVMIGFALFFAMIAGVYYIHNQKVESKELYEVAHYVVLKLTTQDSPIISTSDANTPLLIDGNSIKSISIEELKNFCNPVGFDYNVNFFWYDENGKKETIKIKSENNIPDKDTVSASRKVAIKFFEGDIRYGEIVVTVWRV